jgi:hypothetical protein
MSAEEVTQAQQEPVTVPGSTESGDDAETLQQLGNYIAGSLAEPLSRRLTEAVVQVLVKLDRERPPPQPVAALDVDKLANAVGKGLEVGLAPLAVQLEQMAARIQARAKSGAWPHSRIDINGDNNAL